MDGSWTVNVHFSIPHSVLAMIVGYLIGGFLTILIWFILHSSDFSFRRDFLECFSAGLLWPLIVALIVFDIAKGSK